MKKLITTLAVVLLLVGCGSKPTGGDKEPDATSVASISDKADDIAKSLGKDGNWITAATKDITLDKDVTVEGKFHDKNDTAKPVYRKLALHTQDDKFNILDNFTLTAPKLIVESENFTVFYGTIKGNIEVKEKGFSLVGTKIEGNITFASEDIMASAQLDKDAKGATVTGEVTVAK